MNPATVTLTFVMLWWLLFFMALPIGVQRDESLQIGNAIGAPKNARLIKKAIYTTLIATTLTFIFFSFCSMVILIF